MLTVLEWTINIVMFILLLPLVLELLVLFGSLAFAIGQILFFFILILWTIFYSCIKGE